MLRVLFTYRIGRVMEIDRMITKKEDLINTYIENDLGELRKAYIDKAIELGYMHQGNRERGLDWYDLPYIAINDSWDDTYVGQASDAKKGIAFSESKLLTLSDLKPRTKTEFVKCEFDHAWEAVKAFEDGEDLYTKRSHKDFVLIDNAPDVLRFLYDLHRKVEIEIDEKQEFIDAAREVTSATINSKAAMSFGMLYDSGKFKLVEK
ncbi:putative coil containing protein [Vibrio phage 455E52-1]|nr:putative coil containing protein [Vibrio phage 455E52-1]